MVQVKKCAWVCLVMLGDRYVPGAIVLAQSIKETDSKHDRICLITDDVSAKSTESLKHFYTHVIVVPLITQTRLPPMQTAKHQRLYGAWMAHSFTKWNILNPDVFPKNPDGPGGPTAEMYDKVCLLDADMVFIENCDSLFLDTDLPAMTFSTPWARPYDGNMHNYYLHADGTELAHNEIVPRDRILQGLDDGFVGKGSVVIVRPDAVAFETFKKLLEAPETLKRSRCMSGFDEQIIAMTYLDLGIDFHHVHQRWNWVVSKNKWLQAPVTGELYEPMLYQWYGASKPWEMNKETWPDLVIWYSFYDNALSQMPP